MVQIPNQKLQKEPYQVEQTEPLTKSDNKYNFHRQI